MKRIKKLFGGQKEQQSRRRASPLWFEQLEDRTLLTVSATLSGSILDVAFDTNNDAAVISVAGSNIRVSSGALNRDFAASSVQGITAHSVAGSGQSLTLNNNVTLSNNLVVQGLANVSATNATYNAATISLTGGEGINVQRPTLTPTGAAAPPRSTPISSALAR